jgi:hypothetical protein
MIANAIGNKIVPSMFLRQSNLPKTKRFKGFKWDQTLPSDDYNLKSENKIVLCMLRQLNQLKMEPNTTSG